MDETFVQIPGPPDMSPPVAVADKDSQESVTLKDALRPLPGTQPSQPHSRGSVTGGCPPGANPTIQLLSRPREALAPDPGMTFSYGKPMKLKPGHFSRPTTSKPMNHAIDDVDISPRALTPIPKAPRHLENVSDQTVSVPAFVPEGTLDGFPPEAQAVGSVPRQLQQASVSRQKPPFEDYQPPSDPCGSRDRPPTPVNSWIARPVTCGQGSVESVEVLPTSQAHNANFDLAGTHPRAAHSESGQQYRQYSPPIDRSTAQAPIQKQRTSLPNDISVPPTQFDERSSNSGSPRQMLVANRPLKTSQRQPSKTSTPIPRPPSVITIHGSNITKKRTPLHAPGSALSSSPSRHSSRRSRETPRLRRHVLSQNAQKQDANQRMIGSLQHVAGVLNAEFSGITEDMYQRLEEIASLKKLADRQREKAARYKQSSRDRHVVIQELEEQQGQLHLKLNAAQKELEERSAKILKVEEKCRTYKEYLNSAIVEQQNLYRATKEKCEDAISQMKAEEVKRRSLQEQERKHAETVRERLSQHVKSTINEYKGKEREWNEKIQNLNEKVQERDAAISREHETSQVLLQQNASIISVQDTVKSLEAKIEHAVSKVTEVADREAHSDHLAVMEMQAKLDQIMERLPTLEEQRSPAAEMISKIQDANEKTIASVIEKLEPVLFAQAETRETLEELHAAMVAYVGDLWASLEDREQMLEDLVLEVHQEDARVIEDLQRLSHEKDHESADLKERLLQMQKTEEQQKALIADLREEIAELEQAQADSLGQSDRLDHLREEFTNLQGETAVRAKLISDLKKQIREKDSTIMVKQQQYEKDTADLHRLLEHRAAEAKAAQIQAVEASQREAVIALDKTKADIEKQLRQVLDERATLQRELETARQKISELENKDSQGSTKIAELQISLQTSKDEAARVENAAKRKDVEQQSAKQQQSTHIKDLESQLATANMKYTLLANNASAYDKAAQRVLGSLKQWTQDCEAIQKIASRQDNKDDDVLSRIDPRFNSLIELHLLQKAVAQYHEAQKEATVMLSESQEGLSKSTTESQAVRDFSAGLAMHPSSAMDAFRRVVIRSPAGFAPSPKPPSPQTEQERRRMAEPPKSIMKYATLENPGDIQGQEIERPPVSQDNEPRQSLLSRHTTGDEQLQDENSAETPKSIGRHSSALNRGPYNRPVAGSSGRVDVAAISAISRSRTRSQKPNPNVKVLEQNVTEAASARDPKRRDHDDQELEASRKKPKPSAGRESSVKSTPHSSLPDRTDQSHASKNIPSAPRKRSRKVLVESQNSPNRSSPLLQNLRQYKAASFVLDNGRPSPSSVRSPSSIPRASSIKKLQDPWSVFSEPPDSNLKNEYSQDSITHSQDIPGRTEASISMSRHFDKDLRFHF